MRKLFTELALFYRTLPREFIVLVGCFGGFSVFSWCSALLVDSRGLFILSWATAAFGAMLFLSRLGILASLSLLKQVRNPPLFSLFFVLRVALLAGTAWMIYFIIGRLHVASQNLPQGPLRMAATIVIIGAAIAVFLVLMRNARVRQQAVSFLRRRASIDQNALSLSLQNNNHVPKMKEVVKVRRTREDSLEVPDDAKSDFALMENAGVVKAVVALQQSVMGYREYFPEREDLLRQILYSLLLKEHALISGEKGTVKTTLALTLVKAVEGARLWFQQIGRSYSDEELFGPFDVKRLREEGEFIRKTDNSILTADIACIDEFLDADERLLRELHSVLFLRRFQRGNQNLERLPLHSVIATTNQDLRYVVSRHEKRLDATIDRFLLRSCARRLQSAESKRIVDRHDKTRAYDQLTQNPPHKISFKDVQLLNRFLEKPDFIVVPPEILDQYHALCDALRKGRIDISDRREAVCRRLLEAEALLRKSNRVAAEDLAVTRYGLIVVGQEEEEKAFQSALEKVRKS